ncbi:hypothetical protein CS369_02645 [Candidatus Symbiopectobacterium sp. 'North America']|uniref:DUF3142 domain-containing protein n=1 Tax=Candidatus Symbiopectobacterium sp. 'North America' TaxID=2794574 RepID=UPI0018C90DAC|nr:DUF3142 domain-containing protein [Candidatus Symbiopectobacterium sp. 'North America']MBG6244000.1 hypothetical protein [Candidatus Symbiopectobacterium sp. 'North America']
MGHAAQILLVVACILFTNVAHAERVNAAHYQDFWLWAAVKPQPVLHQAHTLYLHQGEIARRQGKTVFLRQGLPASALRVDHLWLSYRITMLDLSDKHLNRMLKAQARWRALGNQVKGIQIDFDARSYQLARYVKFLQTLRQRLPADTQLSVTGLLDWAKTGDVGTLNRLGGVIDELVVQTYQGRSTVTRYAEYLPALMKLQIPFRLGLVQHGQWDERWQRRLAASAYYRGNVVFLVNPPPERAVFSK